MATYTITINEKTKAGKSLLALIKTMTDIVTIKPVKPTGVDKGLEDIQKGRVHKAKNVDDLLDQCLS